MGSRGQSTCGVCGKAFDQRVRGGKEQKYCSSACRTKAKQGFKRDRFVRKKKQCALPGCEVWFEPERSQRFCCVEHRKAARNCTKCGVAIPDSPGTKTRMCRSCEAALRRQRRLDPTVKAGEVGVQRARKYGISPTQYEEMSQRQRGLCAICGQPETASRRGIPKTLAVDHDHETGAIRELLCNRCNTALGLFMDDPGLLAVAESYLRRHKTLRNSDNS